MKSSSLILILILVLAISSCTKEESEEEKYLNVENAFAQMNENPDSNQFILEYKAKSNLKDIEYYLGLESATGAFLIDSNSGALYVRDKDFFDFETNPVLTSVVVAESGTYIDSAIVQIELKDINERYIQVSRLGCNDSTFINYYEKYKIIEGRHAYRYGVTVYISFDGFRWVVTEVDPQDFPKPPPIFVNNNHSTNTFPPKTNWLVTNAYCKPDGTFEIL